MFTYFQWINILHIFIIAPLLFYVAYQGYYGLPIPSSIYIIVGLIALWALLYHLYKLILS